MPYVQRKEGKIVARFANPQPGYAEEFVEENAPELEAVIAAENAPRVSAEDRLAALEERITLLEKR